MWSIRQHKEPFDPYVIYAEHPTLITIKLHHNGVFTTDYPRKYVKGVMDYIDEVDIDKFSIVQLCRMVIKLGHSKKEMQWFHFRKPLTELDDGLHALGNDSDIRFFITHFPQFKEVDVYVEHGKTNVNTYLKLSATRHVTLEELPCDCIVVPKHRQLMVRVRRPLLLDWDDTENTNDVPPFEQMEKTTENLGCTPTCENIPDVLNTQVSGLATQTEQIPEVFNTQATGLETQTEQFPEAGDVGGLNTQASGLATQVQLESVGGYEGDNSEGGNGGRVNSLDENNFVEFEIASNGESVGDAHDDASDSEFDVENEEQFDTEVDMSTFHENVDFGVDGEGSMDPENENNFDEDPINFSDYESGEESDRKDIESARRRELKRLEKADKAKGNEKTHFYVGQCFGSRFEVREYVRLHAIETRRELSFVKNDKQRIRAICNGPIPVYESGPGETSLGQDLTGRVISGCCPWVVHISTTDDDKTWIVRTHCDNHLCLQTRRVSMCTQSFLADQISSTLASNPEMSIKSVQQHLHLKFDLEVSAFKSYRAKALAVTKIRGDFIGQYARLRDYVLELQRTNEGTTVKIDVYPGDPNSDSRQFRRIYICLGPLKQGFRACHREILGLDGAFMKGPFPGQVLTAVGVDPNNGIYPLAYAVVEAETTSSWKWFLECLGDDLQLTSMSNFTFISDRQKGIIPALAAVFPNPEHRYCLRHIHQNMKKQWVGKGYKDHLWRCASATNVSVFEASMIQLREFNEEVYRWVREIDPRHWTRSHFTGRAHCDALLNNMCEVFNRRLVDARDKPIINCLDYIREYLMRRIVTVQKKIEKSSGSLTPTATTILEGIKREATAYNVIWNGGIKYEVLGPWMDQCVVDVLDHTCTCGRWQLTGMPCKHSVATIWYMALNGKEVGIPERWAHRCYWTKTWEVVYSFKVNPMAGREFWAKSTCPTTLRPPKHHAQIGRPTKKRSKATDEMKTPIVKGTKLSRAGRTITCNKCKKRGHNSRTCKGQEQERRN